MTTGSAAGVNLAALTAVANVELLLILNPLQVALAVGLALPEFVSLGDLLAVALLLLLTHWFGNSWKKPFATVDVICWGISCCTVMTGFMAGRLPLELATGLCAWAISDSDTESRMAHI